MGQVSVSFLRTCVAYHEEGSEDRQSMASSQDAVANCVCCLCWNWDYTLKTTHSRENSLHKFGMDNEL